MTPIEIVTRFLAASSGTHEDMAAAVRETFTDATVWENVGVATTVGPEEALAFANQAEQAAGFVRVEVETLHIAAAGDIVLTERIDRLFAADGRLVKTIPIMGAFEVDGASIVRWRDYLDTAGFAAAGRAD